jgi:hypothetical protein
MHVSIYNCLDNSESKIVTEVDYRIIKLNEFSSQRQQLRLTRCVFPKRWDGVIVCKYRPHAIVHLEDLLTDSNGFLDEFFVSFNQTGFQFLWGGVNRTFTADILRPGKDHEKLKWCWNAQFRRTVACKGLKTLEEFDKVMVFATEFACDFHGTVTPCFDCLCFIFAIEKNAVLRNATANTLKSPHKVQMPKGSGILSVCDDGETMLDLFHNNFLECPLFVICLLG